jgi:hypothetical protein
MFPFLFTFFKEKLTDGFVYLSRLMTSSTTTPYYAGTKNIVDSSATGDYREIQPGRCLNFNGTTQYINVPDSPDFDITDELTVSIWAAEDINKAQCFISKTLGTGDKREWAFYKTSSSYLRVLLSGDGVTTAIWESTSNSLNTDFSHYVFTFSASGLVVKRNNNVIPGSIISGSLPTSLHNDTEPVKIGLLNDSGYHYDGKLFDARIYNRVLTDDEITAIYRQGLQPDSVVEGPDATNLASRWLLDDSSETTAYDSSGNGNHGTIVGYTSEMLYEGSDVPYSAQNLVGWSGQSGFVAGYLRFDGINDHIYTGPTLDSGTDGVRFNNAWTVSFDLWLPAVQPVSELKGIFSVFASNSHGGSIFLKTDGTAYAQRRENAGVGTNYSTSDIAVPTEQWVPVTLSFDDSFDLTLDIDGTSATVNCVSGGNWGSTNRQMRFGILSTGNHPSMRIKNFTFVKTGTGAINLSFPFATDTGDNSGDGRAFTLDGFGSEVVPRDESDPANDVLGNPLDYTGTAPKYATPVDAPCLTFNGSTQTVQIADDPVFDLTTELTFSAWAKNDGAAITSPGERLASKYQSTGNLREWSVAITSDEKIRFTASANGFSVESVDSDNVISSVDSWHHYAVTYNSGVVTMYVDGVEVPSTIVGVGTVPTSLFNGSAAFEIGSVNEGTTQLWGGQIFDARVYGTALSADDVAAIYNETAIEDDPVFWLPLSEGDGDRVYDVVNGNNYEITGYASTMWDNKQSEFFYSFENGCGEAIYYEDFSDGIGIWAATTGATLEAVEFEGRTCLKYTIVSSGDSQRIEFWIPSLVDDEFYDLTFDAFIPSTNVRPELSLVGTVLGSNKGLDILDQWSTISDLNDQADTTKPMRIYPATSGGFRTGTAGDVYYFSNFKIVPVTTPAAFPALSGETKTVIGEPITGLPGLLNSDTYNLNLLPQPDAPYQRSAIPGAKFDGVGDYVETPIVDIGGRTLRFTFVYSSANDQQVFQFSESGGRLIACTINTTANVNADIAITISEAVTVPSDRVNAYQVAGLVVGEFYSIEVVLNATATSFESATINGSDLTITSGDAVPYSRWDGTNLTQSRIGLRESGAWPFGSTISDFSFNGFFEYDFRENNGLVIPDRSGNGNDGTLVVNSSLDQIFAPTALETAYTLGDGRTRPHYVTVDGPNEKDFRTEII